MRGIKQASLFYFWVMPKKVIFAHTFSDFGICFAEVIWMDLCGTLNKIRSFTQFVQKCLSTFVYSSLI